MNTLREALQSYLAMRRALGFKLSDAGPALSDFVAFLERNRESYITIRLALKWAQKPGARPERWAHRLTYVRGLARYRSATDPRTEIPPWSLLPFRSRRAQPYLYTDAEIRLLLKASLGLSPTDALRRWTYYSLLGLLAVSGLRISEALSLRLSDVDLQDAVLTIQRFMEQNLASRAWFPFTLRRKECFRGTSHVEIGTSMADRLLTFSSLPNEARNWIKTTSAGRFMLCRGRRAYVVSSIVGDRACTTSVTDSPFKLFCTGIVPATMPRDFFPFFPLISDTSVQMIRTGI